ncbi:MAG: aminotransferase, partial [Pseudomonadota bacterium]
MLTCQRAHFDIPRETAFLTAASYSPLPKQVEAAGFEGVRRKCQPWLIDRKARSDINGRARATAARLINAPTETIALVPSVSYGFATAAQVLPPAQG